VVKAAGSEVKPLISPSSELGVSSGPEEEDGWGERKLSMKLMPIVYTVQVCFLKTTTVKNGFYAKKCLKWAHTVCAKYRK
jgi:hypothetical protein